VPAEGSKQATAAASEAPKDEESEEIDAFNAHLMDNYDGLDWASLKKYMRPLATYKFKKSWVYRHGYCVVRRSNPHLVFWVCHRCYRIKATNQGRGILQTTKAISAALRHLELHKIYKPGKAPMEKLEVSVYR
jgi:hypothetical protein